LEEYEKVKRKGQTMTKRQCAAKDIDSTGTKASEQWSDTGTSWRNKVDFFSIVLKMTFAIKALIRKVLFYQF
jgi:hypothetical protein